MSQVAGTADDFEVETNDPINAVSEAPADSPDIIVETPDAPNGRRQNGQFLRADGTEPADEVETDEDDAADPDETPEPEPVKKAKPRNDPNARVNQAIARQREAERRADAAERRAAEFEARQQAERAPEPPKVSDRERYLAMPNAPKEADYANYADFSADLALFITDQRWSEREQAARQTAEARRIEQATHAVNQTFATQIDAATKADPDFLSSLSDDVLQMPTFSSLRPGEQPTGWHVLGEEIRRSAVAPEIMRRLSDHPDELQRLATLQPRDITRALAIFESRLGAAPSGPAPARVISAARPPIRPERSTASRVDDDGSDDESVDAYIRRENLKESQRRRSR